MPKRILPPNEILIADYESGLSSAQIAEKYGAVNGSVVTKHLRSAGVQMRDGGETRHLMYKNGSLQPTAYWTGKKQPPEMIESRVSKIRGENHYLWKGGESKRDYRDVIEKHECAKCQITKDLCIHHIDFDHFNNAIENLQVLCNGCHISLHKTEYWRCKREGIEYKSNAPIGWDRDGTE